MRVFDFLIRLLQSRFADGWFRTLSLQQREQLLLQLWRSTNKGLDYRERNRLLRKAYIDRRMKNHPMNPSDEYARIHGLFDLIGTLRQTQGDVVECGVGRGLSLASLVYAVSFYGLDKTVYAFDSFAGFPPASLQDVGDRVKEAGKRPPGWEETSPDVIAAIFEDDRESVTSLLRRNEVRLEIVPGFFEDTLLDRLPLRIAFLHVDCDLYDSTKTVLGHCLPRMAPGGIIIFDEYSDERWPGARKAADEVCATLGLDIIYFDNLQRFGIRTPGATCDLQPSY